MTAMHATLLFTTAIVQLRTVQHRFNGRMGRLKPYSEVIGWPGSSGYSPLLRQSHQVPMHHHASARLQLTVSQDTTTAAHLAHMKTCLWKGLGGYSSQPQYCHYWHCCALHHPSTPPESLICDDPAARRGTTGAQTLWSVFRRFPHRAGFASVAPGCV